MGNDFELKVLSGSGHPQLAEDVCRHLGISVVKMRRDRFPDGEIDVKIEEDMRGCDVFLLQPTSPPVNENLMEMLVILDCLRRASAARITAVIPYFGYARQDRKAEGRVPITAKLVANLIVTSGANRILTIDLHAAQIQGFFDIPVDELLGYTVLVPYISDLNKKNLCVMSPDVGGTRLARNYSRRLGCDMVVLDKRRLSGEETIVYNLIGSVEGKNVVLVDDMIATGGTVVDGARVAMERGARSVIVCATHGVFASNALERLEKTSIEQIVVTDTILQRSNSEKLKVLSVAPMLADAIRRIHENLSISEMFD